MDGDTFDSLVRALPGPGPRRQLIRALASGLLGMAVGMRRPGAAALPLRACPAGIPPIPGIGCCGDQPGEHLCHGPQGLKCCSGNKRCCAGSCQDCCSNANCTGGKVCCGGICKQCCSNANCSGGKVCCGGTCKQCCNDANCVGGKSCQNGACVCPAGHVDCGGICRQCCNDAQCLGGRTCQNGTCACPSGQVDCGVVCQQCCNNTNCPSGKICLAGLCVGGGPCGTDTCTGNEVCCPPNRLRDQYHCVVSFNDVYHCGSCKACEPGQVCYPVQGVYGCHAS